MVKRRYIIKCFGSYERVSGATLETYFELNYFILLIYRQNYAQTEKSVVHIMTTIMTILFLLSFLKYNV